MRRRQVWAAQNQGNVTIPSVPAPAIEVTVLGKGDCRYCGRRIGKGIYFHEQWCRKK